MRVFLDNVDLSSSSGPNSFALKLAHGLTNAGHTLVEAHESPEIQLSFIQATKKLGGVPIVQRLDGIWFNTAQQWRELNKPIRATFDAAQAVIVQSEFDRKLVERFFGARADVVTIPNGADVAYIEAIDPMHVPSLADVEKVWVSASAWRPHKRLRENIRYFLEHAGPKDCLVIAGENPDVIVADKRVFWTGKLDYRTLLSFYRAADYFLHLAWLDHCPNVVVDARAAGAHIICTSSGGTHEIAGLNSTIIEEPEWDFQPCELYNPPNLDFTKKRSGNIESNIDIVDTTRRYIDVLSLTLGA